MMIKGLTFLIIPFLQESPDILSPFLYGNVMDFIVVDALTSKIFNSISKWCSLGTRSELYVGFSSFDKSSVFIDGR